MKIITARAIKNQTCTIKRNRARSMLIRFDSTFIISRSASLCQQFYAEFYKKEDKTSCGGKQSPVKIIASIYFTRNLLERRKPMVG